MAQSAMRRFGSLLYKLRPRISLAAFFTLTTLAAIVFSCHEKITIHREHIVANQLLADQELEFDYGVFPATQEPFSFSQYINPPDTFADLQQIRIRSGDFTKANVRKLLSFRNVDSIEAWNVSSLTPLLRELARDRRIKFLSIGNDILSLTDADISYISNCQSIVKMELYANTGDADSLEQLQALPNLTHLTLAGMLTNDRAIEAISMIDSLESVELISPLITDRGVQHLARLPNLKRLAIYNAAITGIGFCNADFGRSLQELKLHYCTISDSGLADIQKISGLKTLRISQESLPTEAIDDLYAERPDLAIDIYMTINDDFPL